MVIEKSGKNVEEAFQAALSELGVTAADVDMEILENPSKGFFGFGAKPARVRVTLKEKFTEKIEIEKPVENPPENIVEKPAETVEVENTEEIEVDGVAKEFNRAEVIDNAKKLLTDVFTAMKVDAQINVFEDETEIIFDLTGKNLGVLIGKHGQTLDALQYLVNLSANKYDSEQKLHFILDVENYRKRRTETLQNLAKGVAQQVWRNKKEIKLEPMNRHERRVIHTTLQDNKKVETHSVGEEPHRCIVVSPKKRDRN